MQWSTVAHKLFHFFGGVRHGLLMLKTPEWIFNHTFVSLSFSWICLLLLPLLLSPSFLCFFLPFRPYEVSIFPEEGISLHNLMRGAGVLLGNVQGSRSLEQNLAESTICNVVWIC